MNVKKGSSSPNISRDENKKKLKPPPRKGLTCSFYSLDNLDTWKFAKPTSGGTLRKKTSEPKHQTTKENPGAVFQKNMLLTLQETNVSHLGKRKIIFKHALSGGYVSFLYGNTNINHKMHLKKKNTDNPSAVEVGGLLLFFIRDSTSYMKKITGFPTTHGFLIPSPLTLPKKYLQTRQKHLLRFVL